MKKPILLFCFFVSFYTVPAQQVAAIPDKNKILIGERIQLEVFGEFGKKTPLAWFAADTIDHFEILDRSKIDTILKGDTVTLKQTLSVTSWDSGKWSFPSLKIGKNLTPPFRVDVGYSSADPNKPYNDIKDIMEVKKPTESKWYWYFIIIIVLIALFMLFFPGAKKKKTEVFVPDQNAYQRALQQLEQLEAGDASDQKLFYTRLVNILREYLQKRKNLQSFSKTTDDLAIQMKQLNIAQEDYSSLLQALRLSDLVKYARFQSSSEERRDAVQSVRKTIKSIEESNAV